MTIQSSQRAGGPGDPTLYDPFVPGQEDASMGDVLAREARAEALYEAIDLLPDRQRECILLSLKGVSNVHIAEDLGISEPAVSQSLARARANLAEELADLY